MYQEEDETVIYQKSNRSSQDKNQKKNSGAKQNFADISGGTGTSIDLPSISNQLNFIMGIHSPRNLKILDENQNN